MIGKRGDLHGLLGLKQRYRRNSNVFRPALNYLMSEAAFSLIKVGSRRRLPAVDAAAAFPSVLIKGDFR